MRIANNILALQTNLNLYKSENKASASSKKVSSGIQINSSKDDPSNFAIATKMSSHIKGLEMANRDSLEGISLVQTAESAMSSIHDITQRMRELAVSSATDTLTPQDREKVQVEIDSLVKEIDSITNKAEYNGIKLLRPEITAKNDHILKIQVGSDKSMETQIELANLTSNSLGFTGIDYTTRNGASDAITRCDNAIEIVSTIRTKFGAYQNRLEFTVTSLDSMAETASTSLSRIKDTDMAKEITEYTKQNLINQSGMSILAQANQKPQQILQLLN